jgi:hypothetical protein
MNLGQMAGEVQRASQGRAEVVGCFKVSGEPIAPAEILAALRAVALERRNPLDVGAGGYSATFSRLEG